MWITIEQEIERGILKIKQPPKWDWQPENEVLIALMAERSIYARWARANGSQPVYGVRVDAEGMCNAHMAIARERRIHAEAAKHNGYMPTVKMWTRGALLSRLAASEWAALVAAKDKNRNRPSKPRRDDGAGNPSQKNR